MQHARRQHDAMATIVFFEAQGERARLAVDGGARLVDALEDRLSAFRPHSDVSRINAAAGQGLIDIGPDALTVLEAAAEYAALSGGAFDVTAGALTRRWRRAAREGALPSDAEVAALTKMVDWRQICLERAIRASAPAPEHIPAARTSSTPEDSPPARAGLTEEDLPVLRTAPAPNDPPPARAGLAREGMAIDLGAIAKGYAADLVITLYRRLGIARGFVNLGGNFAALGRPTDGRCWTVGLQAPGAPPGTCLATLHIEDASAVTSGAYYRGFDLGGRRWHHIVDPRTGAPCRSDVASATVVSPSSMRADALSTTITVLGSKAGLALIGRITDAEAVIVTDSGQIHVTEGLRGRVRA